MIRKISTVFAIALFAAMMNTGGASAQDDRKSVSGVECLPRNLAEADNFRYGAGSIINRSSKKRRVTCAILRDRFDEINAGGEIDNVDVFVVRSGSARSNLSCTFLVRNIETGAVLVSSSAVTSAVGPAILTVASGLDYGTPPVSSRTGTDNAIYELNCTLPEKSRIRGIRYEEDEGTDGERE